MHRPIPMVHKCTLPPRAAPSLPRGKAWLQRGYLIFNGNRIEAAPEIPGRDTAPWPPGFGERRYICECHRFAVVVVEMDRLEQADITERQYVRAQQVEHQKHLCGPPPDAFDLDKVFDDLVFVARRPSQRLEFAFGKMAGEVADVLRFAFR